MRRVHEFSLGRALRRGRDQHLDGLGDGALRPGELRVGQRAEHLHRVLDRARFLPGTQAAGAVQPRIGIGGQLAVVHPALGVDQGVDLLEPLPVLAETPPVDMQEYYEMWEEMLKRDVWPQLRAPAVETMVRHGHVVATLLREVHEWEADLLVVGSHGKNLAQRVLLGQARGNPLARWLLPRALPLLLRSPLLPRLQRRLFFGVPLPPLDPEFSFRAAPA